MTKQQAILYKWCHVDLVGQDGEVHRVMAMVPHRRYRQVATQQFVEGEDYVLGPVAQRSMASHGHFFAQMGEYYHQLPETVAARWPSADHFRKWCLVETGWYDEREFEMASEEAAYALGHFIRTEDEFARIFIRGAKVLVHRAKSQSLKDMGKEDFEASKKDVLELAAGFVGVSPAQMRKEAGRHD